MKKVIAVLAIILVSQTIGLGQEQSYKPTEAKLYQSLIGEVYVLTLFVDTQYGSWEQKDMDYYYAQLIAAQEWLQIQAEDYDQSVTFNNDYFFNNKQQVFIRSVDMGNSRYALNTALRYLNYKDFNDFLQQNHFDFKVKKLKIVFFVNSLARSHAYNYWSNNDVDVAFVYAVAHQNYGLFYQVIAHEMLHQFGAWDLYYGECQTKEKAAKALQLYPTSIMIDSYHRDRAVDELTAWRIGWVSKIKEEYLQFTPEYNPKRREEDRGDGNIRFDLKNIKKKKEEQSEEGGN